MRHLGSSVSVATLAAGLVSCSDGVPATDLRGVLAPPGAQEGTLVRYVATFDDGHSERWYSLQRDDASPSVRLAFDAPGAAGCTCDAAGAAPQRQPAWASLGLLTGLVWTARRKKPARRS